MDDLMVAKAVFLLREARVSRQDAVRALGEYFPCVAFADRLRCVQEASDLALGGAAGARSPATADRPHGRRRTRA